MTLREKQIKKLMEKVKDIQEPPIDRSWSKLGPMLKGYIETALAASVDNFTGDPLTDNYSHLDIEEATLRQLGRDCVHFYWRNRQHLEELYEVSFEFDEYECGKALWYSRNQAKNAFGSFGSHIVWQILEQSARSFGPMHLWVNEQGKIAANYDFTWRDLPDAQKAEEDFSWD